MIKRVFIGYFRVLIKLWERKLTIEIHVSFIYIPMNMKHSYCAVWALLWSILLDKLIFKLKCRLSIPQIYEPHCHLVKI